MDDQGGLVGIDVAVLGSRADEVIQLRYILQLLSIHKRLQTSQ